MSGPITRALVRKILQRAEQYHWTVQGFGMMRLNLDEVGRIHVWHKSIQVPHVSVIHDHFWDLRSDVVVGRILNTRYDVIQGLDISQSIEKPTHHMQTIITGEGGGLVGDRENVILEASETEIILPGQFYTQRNSVIHDTDYDDGTVTILQRHKGGAGETARVFWPYGEEWVTAEPRSATRDEVIRLSEFALGKFT